MDPEIGSYYDSTYMGSDAQFEALSSWSCKLTFLCICTEEDPVPVDVLETREALS